MSSKRIWQIAWPMILSNITVPLLGVVDTGVIGHLSSAKYLAAVAVGASLFDFLFWSFGFLRMSTTGLIAQHKSNSTLSIQLLIQSLCIALVLSCLLLFFHRPLFQLSMKLMAPPIALWPIIEQYFKIRIWSSPACLFNMVFMGWYIGHQNSKLALKQVLLTNAIAITLDILFVMQFKLSVRGVAWASVMAQVIGLSFFLTHFLGTNSIPFSKLAFKKLLSFKEIKPLLLIKQNIFIRSLSLMLVFACFTRQGAQQGATVLAANAVLMNLQHLMSYGLDGFAVAAETLIGACISNQNRKQLQDLVIDLLMWSLGVAAIISLSYLIFGRILIHSMTNIQTVQTTALVYLPWLVLLPLVSVWSYLYDGIFIGATWSKDMRNSMVGASLFFFVLLWVTQGLNNHGLWLSFILFMAARGLLMYLHYRQKIDTMVSKTPIKASSF